MTFLTSGNLITDKQTIQTSFEWNTQTEWEAYQSNTDIQIDSGVLKLADWTPDQIASLAHWYDATQISGSDGDAIGTWTDQEGTENLTESTSSKKPTLRTDGINGLNTLEFDGSDDRLNKNFADISQPYQIFAIYQKRSSGTQEKLFDGTTDAALYEEFNRSSNRSMLAGGTRQSGSSGTTNAQVLTTLFNGASSVARIDGTQDISGDVGSNALDGLTVGANRADGQHGDYDVGEVLVYDADLSDTNRNSVETYLSDKWGITI